jgi:hypothetical protein
MRMTGVNSPTWSEKVKKAYRSRGLPNTSRPEDDYIALEINGTTFSGLSFRTTLGNTLRSIAYAYYYISLIDEPDFDVLNTDRVFLIASGDDVSIWAEPILAHKIKNKILELTTRDRSY